MRKQTKKRHVNAYSHMFCFYNTSAFRFVVINNNWHVKEQCNANRGNSRAKINLDS
jgi:hypothetical protein